MTTIGEPHGSGPLSVADLDLAEQFVLWALRRRLEGAARGSHLEHGFRLARDATTGGAALAAFESWFGVMATHCWRDLHLHRAPCSCLSADERTMLELVASAQAGDEMRLHQLAAGLVHPQAIGSLQQSSRILATALRRLGLRLTNRPTHRWGRTAAALHEATDIRHAWRICA